MKNYRTLAFLQPRARTGVSLTEVLVSMVIMSIGVILLCSLLPISILRTAQATQLTQSVMLRNNAEAALESNLIVSSLPRMGILSNAQICGFQGLAIIDPLGYFLVNPDGTSTSFGDFSLAAPSTRVLRTSGGVFNRDITWGNATLTAAQLANATAQADQLATLPDSWTLVREDIVTSYDAAARSITVRNVTTDLETRNGVTIANPVYRIVMFDGSAQFAVNRPLYRTGATPTGGATVGANELSWQNVNAGGVLVTPAPPLLPAGFVPTRVRIEVRERRFTWLMTVRKRWIPTGSTYGPDNAPGIIGVDDDNRNGADDIGELHIFGSDDDQNWAAEIEIAVFFNRSFNGNDETSHVVSAVALGFDGEYGVAGVDDDNNGTDNDPSERGWPGSDDNRTLTISLTNKPFLKKGGYMLEPSQLKWYRIVDFEPDTGMILFDQDIKGNSVGQNVFTVTQGIFMKGVVDVYSIGSRTGQQ